MGFCGQGAGWLATTGRFGCLGSARSSVMPYRLNVSKDVAWRAQVNGRVHFDHSRGYGCALRLDGLANRGTQALGAEMFFPRVGHKRGADSAS
jgi:hypothetical protein